MAVLPISMSHSGSLRRLNFHITNQFQFLSPLQSYPCFAGRELTEVRAADGRIIRRGAGFDCPAPNGVGIVCRTF